MSLLTLTDIQQQILDEMLLNNNISIFIPCGYGKKVILSHFFMYLETLLCDIYESISIVILVERLSHKQEWLDSLIGFSNVKQIYNENHKKGKLNIYILNSYKLPENIVCDYLITDIQSFRLLKRTIIISQNIYILTFCRLSQNQHDIIAGIFHRNFETCDKFIDVNRLLV